MLLNIMSQNKTINDMKTLLLLIFSMFLLASCSDMTDERHIYIDPILLPHYKAFILEGSKRGIDLSNEDISMSFKKMKDCGLAVYSTSTIYIDSTSFCWESSPREVVFHELGHLLLHREHDNSIVNDRIKSIMYASGYIINFEANEDYYYEELFNPNTILKPNPYQTDSLVNDTTKCLDCNSLHLKTQ